MSETAQEGLAASTEQTVVNDPLAQKIQSDMAAKTESEQVLLGDAPEQPSGEQNVETQQAPTASMDYEKQYKELQKGFTQKTQEYSRRLKEIENEKKQNEEMVLQLRSILNQPQVYSRVAELYNLPGAQGGNGKTSKLDSLDPEAKSILEEIEERAVRKAKQEMMQELAPKLGKISSLEQLTQKEIDDRAFSFLQKEGYEVTDDVREAIDTTTKRFPGISVIEAFKLTQFDKAKELGARQKVQSIQRNTATVQKPGFSSALSKPTDDRAKSLEQIFEEELRRSS